MYRIKDIMTWLAAILLLSVCYHPVVAQEASAQKHFIFIQNEGGTPFYVKKDNDVISSTPAGYLIIPQLSRGKYQLTIGFPGTQVPEASYSIDLSGSDDKGFLLKAVDNKLHLYALKDLSTVKPLAVASAAGNRIVDVPVDDSKPKPAKSPEDTSADLLAVLDSPASEQAPIAAQSDAKPEADSSDFAKMLNEITGKNTPSVAVAPNVPKDEVPENKNQTPAIASDTEQSVISEPAPQDAAKELPAPGLSDGSDNTATQTPVKAKPSGDDLAFITFIPDSSAKSKPPPITDTEDSATASPLDSLAARLEQQRQLRKAQREKKRLEKKAARETQDTSTDINFADFEPTPPAAQAAATDKQQEAQATAGETPQAQGIPNSDCKNLADDQEFQKVRRKMASRTDDEGIFRTAERYLKGGTCYSAAQVQSLTYLFASDEYKYKFLELAYPHVYDTVHFPALVKTLTDSYYRGRFNALVGK